MTKPKKGKYFRGSEGRQRLVDHALDLVDRPDPSPLTFKALAHEAGLSDAAPIHVFGGIAGLRAAVGAEGFARLTAALNAVARCATGLEQLAALAIAHARFGLEHANLYRVMHHAETWTLAAGPISSAEDGPGRRRTRVHDLSAMLLGSRAEALAIFVAAARRAAQDGSLNVASDEVDEAAHLLTTLTDGFLFQAREERVMEGRSVDEQLESYRRRIGLVVRALGGEGQSRH